MFARKARRAWGLAERTNQPTTDRSAHSELSPSRAMLDEAVVRSVPCRRALARDSLFRERRRALAMPDRRVMCSVTFGGACSLRNGRGRREVAFALAGAKRGVLAPASGVVPAFAVYGYPHSLCGRLVPGFHRSGRPVGGRTGGDWRQLAMRAGGSSNFSDPRSQTVRMGVQS